MKRLILAVLVSALGAASTVTFPQSAKADYPYDRHSGYDRGGYPHYDHDRGYYRDRGYYYHRHDRDGYYYPRYYPRPYYYGGYYGRPHSHFELVVPLIFR